MKLAAETAAVAPLTTSVDTLTINLRVQREELEEACQDELLCLEDQLVPSLYTIAAVHPFAFLKMRRLLCVLTLEPHRCG